MQVNSIQYIVIKYRRVSENRILNSSGTSQFESVQINARQAYTVNVEAL